MKKSKAPSLAALGQTFDHGVRMATGSRAAWLKGTFEAATALVKARRQFTADRQFHVWLAKRKMRLSKDARAGLITIGENKGRARKFFQERESTSWRACADFVRLMVSLAAKPKSPLKVEYTNAAPAHVTVPIERHGNPPNLHGALTGAGAPITGASIIPMRGKPSHLRAVESEPDPAELQRAISAAREVFEVSRFSTKDVASYWAANNKPTANQVREAAAWLGQLADALQALEASA
jgi:hypothetical protein